MLIYLILGIVGLIVGVIVGHGAKQSLILGIIIFVLAIVPFDKNYHANVFLWTCFVGYCFSGKILNLLNGIKD